MDYQKIYNQIIERAKSENRVKGGEIYYENHHITPKCLGGKGKLYEFNHPNLILLTAREHFLCHLLLVEIFPDQIKLKHALWLMNQGIVRYTKKTYSPSSKIYERLKLERNKHIKGENSNLNKPIIQYDLDGNFIKKWPNASIPSFELKISNGDICCVCRLKQKTAGGFQWRYYENFFEIKIPKVLKYQKPIDNVKPSPLKGKKRKIEHIRGRYKPISQYDKQNNLVKHWEFIREACSQFGENIEKIESNIGACCRGKQKTAYGFKWIYQNTI